MPNHDFLVYIPILISIFVAKMGINARKSNGSRKVKHNSPPPTKKRQMYMSPKHGSKKALPPPSSTQYKDITKKFTSCHDSKSFFDVMYTHLCPDCPVAEGLINPEFSVPDPPRNAADADARKDHSRHYGKYKIESDVKKIISFVYSSCCESYQRSIVTKFEEDKWKLLKTVPELLSFVKHIQDIKIKEKGSKQSVIAKARKAIASMQQFDYEDGNSYVARGQRLSDAEKAITTNFTPVNMVIEYLKDGLKPTYSSLIEKWQLDEITGDEDANPLPTTLDELSLVLTNFEQRSRKFSHQKSGPNNFATDIDRSNNSGSKRKKGKDKGCITCSIAGRDSDHDFKTCKHSIKWREQNKKKVLTTLVEKSPKKKTKKNKKVRIEEPISDVESSDVDVDADESE